MNRRFRFNDFFGSLREHGYELEPIEYMEWRQKLMVREGVPVWAARTTLALLSSRDGATGGRRGGDS